MSSSPRQAIIRVALHTPGREASGTADHYVYAQLQARRGVRVNAQLATLTAQQEELEYERARPGPERGPGRAGAEREGGDVGGHDPDSVGGGQPADTGGGRDPARRLIAAGRAREEKREREQARERQRAQGRDDFDLER